jgi:formate C-acetyltransferase/benzylsuccinate synthase
MFDGFDPLTGMQTGVKTGDCTEFETFEQFYQAWYEQMNGAFKLATGLEHKNRNVEAKFYPKPMTSALYERCIETGENSAKSYERSSPWFTLIAFNETGDCLAAVKKLIYDDKKYTMAELRKALEANWEGYEDMRVDFVKAPKWGNDDDYVDQVWTKMYEDLGKLSWSVRDEDVRGSGKAVLVCTGHQWPAVAFPAGECGRIHSPGTEGRGIAKRQKVW